MKSFILFNSEVKQRNVEKKYQCTIAMDIECTNIEITKHRLIIELNLIYELN